MAMPSDTMSLYWEEQTGKMFYKQCEEMKEIKRPLVGFSFEELVELRKVLDIRDITLEELLN